MNDLVIRETIFRNLKRARYAKNKTQSEIAKFLKVNRSTYIYYESGKCLPRIGVFLQLSEFFDVDINFFVK